jgi:hypothetical protein
MEKRETLAGALRASVAGALPIGRVPQSSKPAMRGFG